MKELLEIQKELKAPKGQFNSFGKYKYRSCEDILESVKPLLSKNSCTLTMSDDIIMVGNRIYVKATAVITNSTGESNEVTAFAREEESKKGMDGSQVTGASSSYARKYALNGLFCIDDNKDSDTTNTGTNDKESNSDEYYLAIQEINGATSLSELTRIYNMNISLHQNKQFISSLSSKRKELENEVK
jgi:hypothetical protein